MSENDETLTEALRSIFKDSLGFMDLMTTELRKALDEQKAMEESYKDGSSFVPKPPEDLPQVVACVQMVYMKIHQCHETLQKLGYDGDHELVQTNVIVRQSVALLLGVAEKELTATWKPKRQD